MAWNDIVNGTICNNALFQANLAMGPVDGYVQLMANGILQGCVAFVQNNVTGKIAQFVAYSDIGVPYRDLNWTGLYIDGGAALSGLGGIAENNYPTVFYSFNLGGNVSAEIWKGMTEILSGQAIQPVTFFLNENSILQMVSFAFAAPVTFAINGSSYAMSYGNHFLQGLRLLGTTGIPTFRLNSVSDVIQGLLIDGLNLLLRGEIKDGVAKTSIRNIQGSDGGIDPASTLGNFIITLMDSLTDCADSQNLAPQFVNATTQAVFEAQALPAQQALCDSKSQYVPGWFYNWLSAVRPSPSPAPNPSPSLSPSPVPNPSPSFNPSPAPNPSPSFNPSPVSSQTPAPTPNENFSPAPNPSSAPIENEKSRWWPYLMPVIPVALFFGIRASAINLLQSRMLKARQAGNTILETRLQQCLQFVRDETAFNILMGATAGLLYTAHAQMNWHAYDENENIFIVTAAFWATELLLNGAAELYDAYLQKQSSDFKGLLINTGISTFLANAISAMSLYFLWPPYTEENFLLAVLGTQVIRQISLVARQGISWPGQKCFGEHSGSEETKPLLNSGSEELVSVDVLQPRGSTTVPQQAALNFVDSAGESSDAFSDRSNGSVADYTSLDLLDGIGSTNADESFSSIASTQATQQPSNSVSLGWKLINAALAVGTTVAVVGTTYCLMNLSEDQSDEYTPGDNTAINTAIGGTVGVALTTVATGLYGFFHYSHSSPCCDLKSTPSLGH